MVAGQLTGPQMEVVLGQRREGHLSSSSALPFALSIVFYARHQLPSLDHDDRTMSTIDSIPKLSQILQYLVLLAIAVDVVYCLVRLAHVHFLVKEGIT